MAGFSVAGRQFRTEADYNAALRDQSIIERIKAEVNMDQPGEVIALSFELRKETYMFHTMVGRDFCDEIHELAQDYMKQGYNKNSRIDPAKLKKMQRKAEKKNRKATGDKNADTVKSSRTGSGRNTNKAQKQTSIEDLDEKMQQEVMTVLKRNELKRKLTVAVCAVVALACFGYYGVYYYFADRTQADYENLAELKGSSLLAASPSFTIHYTEDEDIELTVLEEYQTLYNKNKSLIGWLKIDDTNIDYPVMQTTNNEYYLDHNYEQEYDKNGSIFLDAECDVVRRNTNLIVYGHHMKSGKMFGSLNKYSSESYCKKHSLIQFDTIYEKGTYEVMYVFRSRIYNEDEITFKYYQFFDAASETEFNSNMMEMAKLSLYDTGVTASYGDELLTLSTCDNSEQEGRFVVVAKRIG